MGRSRLLGASALIAAGVATPAVAADPIKLELRGYWNSYITLGKIGRDVSGTTGTSYRPETFRYEGEIWFSGETKLDNGTTVGIRIELEGWSNGGGATSTNDQMDEEYLYAFGPWGRIEFGATDAASYKNPNSSPSVLPGWGFQDPTFAIRGSGFASANNGGRDRGTNPGMSASNLNNAGDADKFTYYSPRFAGLQVALSYTPSFAVSAPAATCPFRGGGANFNNCPRNNNTWHNGIDVSANYANKFGDVEVRLAGSYMTAGFDRGTISSGLAATPVAADNASTRYKSWAAGAQLGFHGFTLGGGLGRDNNGLRHDNATRWYTAAIRYDSGPWMTSLGWWGGRNNDANAVAGTQNAPGKDKMDIIELGVAYMLSPGIRLLGGLNYVMGSGQSKSEKADAWAIIVGTGLTF
ncbi:porin [Vineibacter terrae]|uniref:porin n=1 Tax=Vineibacter terrae TaxID=2586908 RepID=UPI002E2F9614|nr:porin [Vineibacter terrae]HEX2888790.1 porin [Vineibacter terrae]